VCGEEKRLMLVPLDVDLEIFEAMVQRELNLAISFTLKVVMGSGAVVPLLSRDELVQVSLVTHMNESCHTYG